MPTNNPFPFMPPKSTELLLMHCDDTAYVATPDTYMYKLVDAICGTTGAGGLVNEVFIARLAGAMETIYYQDLDYIFSNTNFLARAPEESYPYNPSTDTLTADQWNEIRIKDAWYRARVRDQFIACGLGSTIEGIRMSVQAAVSADCDTYEVWRYVDNFGITADLGRSPTSARNEVVIKPHKDSLEPSEMRLVRDMLSRFVSLDTIVTVNVRGLSVQTPVFATAAASDSTYYEVQKVVTPTPIMAQMPAPEYLPIDLLPSEQWMYSNNPALAPYAAFNITQEYGFYYLTGGGSRSPIDSVTYGTINPAGPVKVTVFEVSGTFALVGALGPGLIGQTPSNTWYDNNLDPDLFQWVPVPYPADLYPMNQSVATGVTNLIAAINSIDGPFILVGYSQGGIVVSNVYDELRTGSLQSRRGDLLGGLAFGNPRRQENQIAPPLPNPGGHGIMAWDLLTDTEPLWWEFSMAGDPASAVQDNLAGQNQSYLMGIIYEHYAGVLSVVIDLITSPINEAVALVQGIIDVFWGMAEVHTKYQDPSTHPIPGDSRDCIQIGADYIASLSLPNLAALATNTPAVNTQVICYEVGETTTSTPSSWFATNLDPRIRYVWVPYPSTTELPLQDAIDAGVGNLTTMITRNAGPFLLVGTGEGAIVTSTIYDELRTGTLQHRRVDLLGAVAFGNPRRQVGTIAPGANDPGGHGISTGRLINTESLWWEFANPGDPLATTGDDANGVALQDVFESIIADYTGDATAITALYPSATVNISLLIQNVINVLFNLSAPVTTHTAYGSTTPITGDTRTSFQIARDYLNTFASRSTPYVAPPVDPMQTYQAASTFESYTSTAQYGPWQTYQVVDSPDNYPGGQFGKTPQTAPALNPDGTPYTFPWPSQQAYITAKATQVEGMGGQADNYHYRLPIGQSSVTKEAFLPEYAIAYSAPTQDSTVSKSLTRARPSTTSKTGWNQVFATSAAAPAGSATSS